MRCRVRGSSLTSGKTPSIWLTRLTSATATIRIAATPITSLTPSDVPSTSASAALPLSPGATGSSANSSLSAPGTINAAMATAAGALISDAIRRLPAASGTTGARMVA